jgi:predicted HD phosphohydrolase
VAEDGHSRINVCYLLYLSADLFAHAAQPDMFVTISPTSARSIANLRRPIL